MTVATTTRKRKPVPARIKPPAGSRPSDKDVRNWAHATGKRVQLRGRVNNALVEEYMRRGVTAATKTIESPSNTKMVETPTYTAPTSVEPDEFDGRALVYLVTDTTTGERQIITSGNVFVDEISLDSTNVGTCVGSLGQIVGLPESPAKLDLIRMLSMRLTDLAAG